MEANILKVAGSVGQKIKGGLQYSLLMSFLMYLLSLEWGIL